MLNYEQLDYMTNFRVVSWDTRQISLPICHIKICEVRTNKFLGVSYLSFNTREFAWSSAMRIFLPTGYSLQHPTNDPSNCAAIHYQQANKLLLMHGNLQFKLEVQTSEFHPPTTHLMDQAFEKNLFYRVPKKLLHISQSPTLCSKLGSLEEKSPFCTQSP